MSDVGTPLPDLCEAYLRSRATRKDSPHTTQRYRNELDAITGRLAATLGKEPAELTVDDLTLSTLNAALAGYAAGRSNSTVAGCCSVWKGFGRWLRKEGVVAASPAEYLDRPKIPKPTPKALVGGADTVDRLLASVERGDRAARRPWPQRDLAVVTTFLASGLRREELARLNTADLDRMVTYTQFRVTGKGGAQRWVPISPELVAVIDEYQTTRLARFPLRTRSGQFNGTEPLLVNDDGGRLTGSQIWHIVRMCYRAAGIAAQVPAGAMVHALRHTYATMLAEQGVAATDIQALLGHDSLSTTQIYVSVSPKRLREVAARNPMLTALRQALLPDSPAVSPSRPAPDDDVKD